MLLGEHAVLHGRRALVCAINRRMTVRLRTLDKPVLKINSTLGSYEEPLSRLPDHPEFRFVLDAVRQARPEQGIELEIQSDFSSDIGFGSSAAVTAATHAVLMRFKRGQPVHCSNCNATMHGLTPFLFQQSLETIRRVQGRGSGADVAASVFGGTVAYRAAPQEVLPLKQSFPLTAVYSGSKMKTVEVIARIEKARSADPERFERIFDQMDEAIGRVLADFTVLGEMLVENQSYMEEMGLCNPALAVIIDQFRKAGIPAKISGSGLGDCAVGLGDFPAPGRFRTFPLRVSPDGCLFNC
jgi:mevalonate kinase